RHEGKSETENDPSLVAARFFRHVKPFFAFLKFFCGAGMPAAPAGNRECLNFSQTQLQGRIPLPITVEPYVPISR
ncbi:MAG TPA: hypothetical protein PK201_13845, partial [Accumulibacter sp.]|nr:hypothetical protein [Accumulibacter sp.]